MLARVPKDRIRDRAAYEFFSGTDSEPRWTKDIGARTAVFESKPFGVYRTHVSYNAPLRRYIMTAILPGEAPRFKGGFGVYDAPEPWGPWTTVSFQELWDVGPGEQQSFPPKWMSADGRTMYLLFSGEDMFSVRRARVKLR
jgi:hypothetical protein